MLEKNVIGDVRIAKAWVDSTSSSLEELGARLRAIEVAFRERSGEFAGVPVEHLASVQATIDGADREPGQELLEETRAGGGV